MIHNHSSICHTIHVKDFKYDVMKSKFLKGSRISKSIHPTREVEILKEKLLQHKILKDMRTHWILRSSIHTGILMAFNLHTGQLEKECPYKQDIVITPYEAEDLQGKLQERQLYYTDSKIVMQSLRDTLQLSTINIINVDKTIINHHSSNSFGGDEAFVLNILQKKGIVSPSARHGVSQENEADIVDDENGEQYEITFEFKVSLSKRNMKEDWICSPETQLLELVDNPYIHTSRSLERKFRKKYTTKFHTNLVILTLGGKEALTSMMKELSNTIEKKKIREFAFSTIYIISFDFLSQRVVFVKISPNEPTTTDSFASKNEDLNFINLTHIEFNSMLDTDKYLIVCNDIFNNHQYCRYDTGEEIKAWAKDIHIWGTT